MASRRKTHLDRNRGWCKKRNGLTFDCAPRFYTSRSNPIASKVLRYVRVVATFCGGQLRAGVVHLSISSFPGPLLARAMDGRSNLCAAIPLAAIAPDRYSCPTQQHHLEVGRDWSVGNTHTSKETGILHTERSVPLWLPKTMVMSNKC